MGASSYECLFGDGQRTCLLRSLQIRSKHQRRRQHHRFDKTCFWQAASAGSSHFSACTILMHTKRLACRNLWFQKLKLQSLAVLVPPRPPCMDFEAAAVGLGGVLLGVISRGPLCPACPRCPDLSCENIIWWPAFLLGVVGLLIVLSIHRLRDYRGYRWTSEGCGEFPATAGTVRAELQLRDIRARRPGSLCMIAPALWVHLRESVKERAELTKALRLAREEIERESQQGKEEQTGGGLSRAVALPWPGARSFECASASSVFISLPTTFGHQGL